MHIIFEQFVAWTKRKIRHHVGGDKKELYYHEKEVWWVALGKNIGHEIDGKNELFERPVIILKKYSKDMCFVLPISTQIKESKPWYQVVIPVEKELRAINITQGRALSTKRLLRKKTILDANSYNKILENFVDQFRKVSK